MVALDPFVLSLSKDIYRLEPSFDRLRTNGCGVGAVS
ncbi:hypothetical protein MNBD_ALPHA04-1328 [hydrothermal vent metagenome]|uniref:Uncharacterized protein n=1 Tax=hydrothermal vent metagenome TaxID=652676 RepID=A0A3B0RD24_9ZZZZ